MKLIINAIKNWIGDEESANSFHRVIGNNREVMIYGLNSCYWQSIIDDCKRQNYIVYSYDNYPFTQIKYDGDCLARECKATLTSLILENVKRVAKDQPIIPLIFVIASDQKKISLAKIASTHGCGEGNITDQELRRLRKIREECDSHVKDVVDLTVKFVKVHTKTHLSCKFYVLEQIPPFWNSPEFEKHWRHRKHHHKTEKEHPWKTILNKKIQKIATTNNFLLFTPVTTNLIEDQPHLEEANAELSDNVYLQRFYDKQSKKTDEDNEKSYFSPL